VVDDRWNLYVDPELVTKWPVPALGSVLVHHTGHLLRDHAGRARALGVDKETAKEWTLAADAEINDDLEENMALPGDPVTPEALGFEPGKLAEEYFHHLMEHEHDEECECGSGSDGQPRDWDDKRGAGIPKNSAHLIRCQVASEILKHCRGKEPGTVPSGLIRWAEELIGSKVDWRKVLAAEIRQGIASVQGKVDYTYSRPSRRASIAKDYILPSLRKPIPDVAVVIDTSGSMSERQLGQVLAEVEGLLRSVGLGKERLRVLSCDADVHNVQRVSSARKVSLMGGGGTNMGAGIDAAMSLRPRPQVVVVLTDGYTPWPASPPKGAKVIIGLIEGSATSWPPPTWARVVRIEEAA
jgi:predicted metal-dependent peptidase